MDVTVYLGAHEGDNPVYKQAVVELATTGTAGYMAVLTKD